MAILLHAYKTMGQYTHFGFSELELESTWLVVLVVVVVVLWVHTTSQDGWTKVSMSKSSSGSPVNCGEFQMLFSVLMGWRYSEVCWVESSLYGSSIWELVNPLTGKFITKAIVHDFKKSCSTLFFYNTMDISNIYRSKKNLLVKTIAIATTLDDWRGTFPIERHYQLKKRKRDILITLQVFNLSNILSFNGM